MIVALLLGRAGSSGFPGKNLTPILGRPMVAYPLMAAQASRYVDRIFVSTDSTEISRVGRQYGADIIDRPAELCTSQALCEDAFRHGYYEIEQRVGKPEMVVLLLANAPTITAALIDQGVETLRQDPTLDSAITVSKYNMWSPLRARKLDPDGRLRPFVPFEAFDDPAKLNCDRDSQGDVFFADGGVSVVRPHCLERLEEGLLPLRWMGRSIAPIISWGGCDVDERWQVPIVEFWLREHGMAAEATPVPKP